MPPAPSHLKLIAGTLLIAGSGIGAYLLAVAVRRLAVPRAPEPVLVLAARSQSLGELREGETTVRKVTIENRSGEDVQVTRIHGDCRCTTFRPTSLKVPAGGKAEVEVEIHLDRSERVRTRADLVIVADAVDAQGTDSSVRWRMSGQIVRDVHPEADHIDFGELMEDRTSIAVRQLRVKTKKPVEWMKAGFGNGKFAAETGHDDDGHRITVRPVTKMPAGEATAKMRVEAKLKDVREPVQFTVTVRALVLSEIEAVPERILGGRRPIGTKWHEELLLSSRSKKPMKLVAAGAEGSVTIAPTHEAGANALRFRIEYPVSREGYEERMVWVAVRLDGRDEVVRTTIPIQVSGYSGVPTPGEPP